MKDIQFCSQNQTEGLCIADITLFTQSIAGFCILGYLSISFSRRKEKGNPNYSWRHGLKLIAAGLPLLAALAFFSSYIALSSVLEFKVIFEWTMLMLVWIANIYLIRREYIYLGYTTNYLRASWVVILVEFLVKAVFFDRRDIDEQAASLIHQSVLLKILCIIHLLSIGSLLVLSLIWENDHPKINFIDYYSRIAATPPQRSREISNSASLDSILAPKAEDTRTNSNIFVAIQNLGNKVNPMNILQNDDLSAYQLYSENKNPRPLSRPPSKPSSKQSSRSNSPFKQAPPAPVNNGSSHKKSIHHHIRSISNNDVEARISPQKTIFDFNTQIDDAEVLPKKQLQKSHSVSEFAVEVKSQQYGDTTYYKFTITEGGYELHSFCKRYKEIKKFHESLMRSSVGSELDNIEFPEKGNLGIFVDKNNPKLVEYRKMGFKYYFQHLMENSRLRTDNLVRDFVRN